MSQQEEVVHHRLQVVLDGQGPGASWLIADCPRRVGEFLEEKNIRIKGQKKTAGQAVCTGSKCFQVQNVHGHAQSTDSIHVYVHSTHVQMANVFSGCAH